MRRIFALLLIALLCCITVVPVLGEEAAAPKLIEAKDGEPAAMQIRSLESDNAVGIIGMESDPAPCTWRDFNSAMNSMLEGISFSQAYWSNGCWVRLVDNYDLVIRVYTTDETDDGLIQSVLVNTPSAEGTGDVQAVTTLAYYAAARPGMYGTYVVQIALQEDHSTDWFTDVPVRIWTENGYALSFSKTEGLDLPCGEVQFSERMTVSGGYLTLGQDYVNLSEGKSPTALIEALTAHATSGPLASWITAPVLPDNWETEEDGRVYLVEWDDCLLILYTDENGDNLRVVNLFSMSGDTNSMCLHLYPLYISVAGGQAEDMMLISAFVGGNGTWDDMSQLEPFCVMNEVQLQCSLADMGDGNKLPMADICGIEPKEAAVSIEEKRYAEDVPFASEHIPAQEEQTGETQLTTADNTAAGYSFHGACWGMTKAEVRALEEDEPYQEPNSGTGHSALVYRVGTRDAFQIIQYNFLPSGALYNITVMAPDADGVFYTEQRENYTMLYGEPLTEAGADLHSDDDPVAVMMAALMQNSGDSNFLGWRADDETVIIMSMEPVNRVCYVEIRRYTDYFRFQ